jgi:hypothetical protein
MHVPGPYALSIPSDSPYAMHRGMDGKPDGWSIRGGDGRAVAHVHQIAGEETARLLTATPEVTFALNNLSAEVDDVLATFDLPDDHPLREANRAAEAALIKAGLLPATPGGDIE